MRRPRECDARDLRRLRQDGNDGHAKCTCPGSNGITRAVNCTECYGRNICEHGRQKNSCRDCANAKGMPLARDAKCPICDKLAYTCKKRGCKPKPE